MKKVHQKLASEIYEHIDLEKDAEALIDASYSPAQYLEALMNDKQYYSAVIFLAHALPKREAVWWACLCSKSVITADTKKDDVDALKAAEQWVYNPNEENRRLAEKLALKTEFVSPPSWAAMGAFWSGGSVTGIDDPPVPPAPYLYAHAVAGAVNLAATIDHKSDAENTYQQFLTQGIDIANGGNGEVAA